MSEIPSDTAVSTGRGIDHLVLPVADLDRAAETYARMGFTLTPKAQHPWGTCNRLVQLDRCFLELLGVDRPDLIGRRRPGHFSFGAFNRDFLKRREGLSMLVLESRDADADIADFEARGLPTYPRFDFERIARQPDGTDRTVAFSLAFTSLEGNKDAAFFTCAQHHPEHFWRPDFQVHANTARSIAAVVMVAPDPADHHIFLSAFTGVRDLHMTGFGLEIRTPRGTVEVLTPAAFRFAFGVAPPDGSAGTLRFAGVRIAVADLGEAERRLGEGGFAFGRHMGAAVVGPDEAHGVAYAFEETTTAVAATR